MRAHEFELPRLNEAKSKACGDCFVVAGRAMIYGTVPEMKLVHAYVTGQGGVEGKRFSHAWNEIGDIVFDYSNGRKVVMRREQYYKIGQVSTEPGEYAVYDDIETAKMIARNKHWGPWDLDPGKERVAENFADGKKPGRKGLAKRVGVNCKQPVSKLRSIAKNSSGEKQRMAHWCANMKSGRNK